MNILFVNEIPMNPTCGGIERVSDILSKELIRRGYNVVYLCARSDENQLNYSFPALQLTLPFDGAFENSKNISFYTEVLTKYKIDIVINQRGWAPFMNKVLGCNGTKVISVIHTIPTGSHIMYMNGILRHNKTFDGIARYLFKLMIYPFYYAYKYMNSSLKLKSHYRYLVKKSSAVVLLSEKCRHMFDEIVKDVNNSCKTYSIPNPNVYKNSSMNLSEKENIILYVGRLCHNEKKPERMLKVWEKIFKIHPNWEMVFVGDGDAMESMRLYVRENNIDRVKFVGQSVNVEDYYIKSYFICLTSDFEGWGMTLTEGMSFGCIPFTFNNYGAASEIIDEGVNGCLIPAFNLKQYAKRLSDLINHSDERVRMSVAAAKKVQSFNLEKIADLWVELFERILNS